jgi:hypothetical protein
VVWVAAIQVDQAQSFPQRDVVLRREIEDADRGLAATHLDVRMVATAHRAWVSHVGDGRLQRMALAFQSVMFRLRRVLFLGQPPAFLFLRLAFGLRPRLANRLGNLVRLAVQFFDLGQLLAALAFRRHQLSNIHRHAAVLAVLLDNVRVVDQVLAVEHREDRAWRDGIWNGATRNGDP